MTALPPNVRVIADGDTVTAITYMETTGTEREALADLARRMHAQADQIAPAPDWTARALVEHDSPMVPTISRDRGPDRIRRRFHHAPRMMTMTTATYSITMTDSGAAPAWLDLCSSQTDGRQIPCTATLPDRCRMTVTTTQPAALEAALDADEDVIEYEAQGRQ